jgi:serpin B
MPFISKEIGMKKFNDAIEDDFHVSENNTVKAQMMTNSESKYGYLSLDEVKAQAVEIPYKGKQISMIVILPNRDSSLEELEAALDVSDLKNFDTRKVDLTLPKFKIETSLDLIDALKNMGMKDMFNPSLADFSKMGHPDSGKIYVSDVRQKAFIEVNEQGTEAAAATFIGFVTRGGQLFRPTIKFTCDRPFMFLIRDKLTDVTLFSGHVTDPTK